MCDPVCAYVWFVNTKVKYLGIKFLKILTFIAFYKLLLDDAKAEILLILWHFLFGVY